MVRTDGCSVARCTVTWLPNFLGGVDNNYSPKWRWLVVIFYRAAKQPGKYPLLATDTEVNNCYLPLRENLVITWPYTEQPSNRPSAPHWSQCLIPHFLASLGAQEQLDIALIFPHFAHQCCDHLTAVKTGCPLTSITWPYRGLRYRPIEIEYFWSYQLPSY